MDRHHGALVKLAPRADELASLRALHERLAAADHFEVLGVARDADTAQVKASYFQLARRYHPDAAPAADPDDAKRLRADLFARIGEAYRVLADERARAEYLARLTTGSLGDVDVSAILRSEEIFRKAQQLVSGRQYAAALAALEEATRLHAEEAEFRVWAGWVRFLLARDRPPQEQQRQHQESAAAIEAALGEMPRCLSGYLFLGKMARIMGDVAGAERHLRRGLALEPSHVELARELKYLKR